MSKGGSSAAAAGSWAVPSSIGQPDRGCLCHYRPPDCCCQALRSESSPFLLCCCPKGTPSLASSILCNYNLLAAYWHNNYFAPNPPAVSVGFFGSGSKELQKIERETSRRFSFFHTSQDPHHLEAYWSGKVHRFYRRDLHTLDIREGMMEVRAAHARPTTAADAGEGCLQGAHPSTAA